MHAYQFTDSGCIVDATVLRRVPGDMFSDNVTFVVRPAHNLYTDTTCHDMDLLPYGYFSPTQIFSKIGRHTNFGLVQSVDLASMRFSVQPSPESMGQPLTKMSGALGDVLKKSRKSFRSLRRRLDNNMQVFSRLLGELQLLPSLSRLCPTPPLPVGTIVWARRFNCIGLCRGVVAAAKYDCTYVIIYDDGMVDINVLHGDVQVDTSTVRTALMNVEPCSVRSRILVYGNERAEVLQCLGHGKYRICLERCLSESVTIDASSIVAVCPFLGKEALKSDDVHIGLFQRLDTKYVGRVSWTQVRHAIAGHSLGRGASGGREFTASAEQLLALKHDLLRMRPGGRAAGDLSISGPTDDEMLVTFAEFDFVLYRVRNLFV
jgi:hypothetical protein